MILEVLAPTFLLVGVGYLLGRFGRVEAQPFAQASFWVFSPVLIFENLRTAQLPPKEAGLVALFVLAHYGLMFLLSLGLGRHLFPSDPDARRATSLVLTFGNCGNLGLPILLFTYGQPGVDVGVVFLATNTILLATLGVAIASWEGRKGLRSMAREILRVPWPYAVVLAVIMRATGAWPEALARASSLLAQGAIPVFLILLGLELANVGIKRGMGPSVLVAAARLILGGAISWALAWAFGTAGVLRGSLILEGSVPTAVNSYILAVQYRRRSDLAAAALLLSTLLSLATLPLTLFLLQRLG